MPIINRIAEFHDDMTAWRRDFHQYPEIGLEEVRTSERVATLLQEFGVDEVHTGIAKTGVVGVIRGNQPGEAIGLRADMDALPMEELTGLPYASRNAGAMHACGHDGHTTMLLGAARYLAETRNFAGTVYVIFQPAEENVGGGRMMVDEGLFERFPMRNVFGMHNWPLAPAGTFLWRVGPIMAAVANIRVEITGKGTHGAEPHLGTDPIVVAAALIQSFQGIVARMIHPLHGGVVTIGSIQGGQAHNVIPQTVRMLGTARWFEPLVGDTLEQAVIGLSRSIASGYGASVDAEFERLYPPTINDPAATELTRRAAVAVVGESRVVPLPMPTMAGEDFSFMLNAKSGSYIMLGAGRGAADPMCHHPSYDFNDDVLPVGASYWAALTEQELSREFASAGASATA